MSNPSVLVLGNLLDEAAETLKVSASFWNIHGRTLLPKLN